MMHMPSNTASGSAALIQASGEVVAPAHASPSSNQNTQVHFALPSPPLNPQDASPSPSALPPPTTPDDLNAALATSLPPSAPSSLPSTPAASEMFLFDYSSEHLEIILPSDNIVLRGVGQDVEPTVFAGQVVLRLSEATNIKEINLSFVGKSRLLNADSRSPAFRQPITTTTFFSHDWSLLEGTKGHKHTLKAGTHTFPFQLNIDDTFPSTISVGNSSSIAYKLRATVVRPSFSANWATQRPVTIVRGFSPEALEYNQTLEIENTWPGKIMYSVMIPHKAFAAGDEVPVSLKFTPLVKGVTVMSIETAIKQYLAVRTRGAGSFQDGRVVAKVTHFLRNGVPVEARAGRRTSPTLWDVSSAYVRTTAIMTPGEQVEPDHLPPSSESSSTPGSGPSSGRGSSENEQAVEDDLERGDNELDTCIKFRLPAWTIPSNMSEPIIVNYKLKWSITLSNLDGHTSELRCALPLHVLSNVLLDEARAASRQTRAVLFGRTNADGEPEEGGEDGEAQSQTILPSYASHVQDRIANALDAVAPTRLAPNPLHHLGGAGSTGPSTPEESHELVDTGLLLSLGESASTYFRNAAAGGAGGSSTTNSDSRRSSFRTGGRGSSSRTSSRATSPEPPEIPGESSTANTTPSSSFGSSGAGGGSKSFFSLKPLTNLANKISHNSRSMSQIAHPATGAAVGMHHTSNTGSPKVLGRGLRLSRPPSSSNLRTTPEVNPQTQMEMLSDLLSRVPNYERASQGFLGGGVLPLESYAGLPTYHEVEEDVSVARVQSDGALLSSHAVGGGSAAGHVYDGDDDVDAMRSATPRPHMPGRSVSGLERRRQASFTLDP